MIKLSAGPKGEMLRTVLIVAFHPVTGEVHGSFAHSSLGDDAAGVERSRRRLVEELRSQLGAKAKVETVTVGPGEMPTGSISRVAPKTRKLVVDERDFTSRGGIRAKGSRGPKRRPKR
jgi:hypothetical protein